MADMAAFFEQVKNFDISEIDWQRVGVWPLPARIFLCVLSFILILVGGYFLLVKEQNQILERERVEEQTLRKSFEKKAEEAANLQAYRDQMVEMEASFGALLQQLPGDTEVPGLLEDIDDKGVASKLDIESIALQPEKESEFYVELPINVVVTGGYHEFGAFVSGVAGMPRIVTLHDFTINQLKDQPGLRMEILAKTYRYKAQEEE